MSTIKVNFGTVSKDCELAGEGVCRNCGAPVIWATTPKGKHIPLELKEMERGVGEPHFSHCPHRNKPVIVSTPERASTPQQQPTVDIEMDQATFRALLWLIHPCKHQGPADVRLAEDMTEWLLKQRPRLTKANKA